MKRFLLPVTACLIAAYNGTAANEPPSSKLPEGAVSGVKVERSASNLIVSMTVSPSAFPKKANRETWMRPLVTAGADSLWLTPVVVAGRTRRLQRLRSDGDTPSYIMLGAGAESDYAYSVSVPYMPWMETGDLELVCHTDGCCGRAIAGTESEDLQRFDFREKVLEPVIVYVKPEGEISKTREIEGEAYIDFPVNKTEIYPQYRRNPQELAEIRQTIDAVRDDSDVSITSLSIKGFASPEGPYANNERLAKGRTEALASYVRQLYSFPPDLMHSDWEAEDWDGLAEWLRASDLPDKEAMLAVVADSGLEPDARDAELKKRFPSQYSMLLKEVYPALRHSDYKVTFLVRDYTDIAEIGEVMRTGPQKLSLEELFLYAQSLDKESPEFREVMEVAVRMFPDDPIANLNAAATAVGHGDYGLARSYLAKAGDSPVAAYTAGVAEAMEGNYKKAELLLRKAYEAGIKEAAPLLENMRDWGWTD